MTDSHPPAPEPRGQLERDASLWCVRMHGEDAEVHRAAFEEWLRQGALHRGAYNRLEEVYLLAGRLRPMAHRSSAPCEPQDHAPNRSHLRFGAVVAVGAIAVMSVATGLAIDLSWSQNTPQAAEGTSGSGTPVRLEAGGDRQLFGLADGSQVWLSPGSVIRVSFSAHGRRVTLLAGTARFHVAHDSRPFSVFAGGGSVTARGTLFDVRCEYGAVDVHLIEGRVDVALPAGDSGPSADVRQLAPGERLRYAAANEQAVEPAAPPPPPITVDQPKTVGELILLANQTADGTVRIELDDAALGSVRLSGSFKVHDPVTTAHRLAAMFDLATDRSPPGVLRLHRKAHR